MIAVALAGLILACLGCALSVALTLRVKQVLTGAQIQVPRGLDAQAGSAVPDDFGLTDLDGLPWRAPSTGGESWLLAFMSLDCGGCKAQMPSYLRYLRQHSIPPQRAVTVLVGDNEVTRDAVPADLLRYTRVLPATEASPVVMDLKVSSWPTYLVVDGAGTVAYATQSVTRLAGVDPHHVVHSAPDSVPA
ncbi:hypothetical protein ABZ916_44275 [Streptomyces sp. NPDC046853]|uniref:TlpA family protein disulfide reductase n=1 Tax=Streptomyces sp. NPDC046853 TaxID=3154920 RepID=UPI0033D79D9B